MSPSWCILGPEMCKESLCGPIPILLYYEDRVVIYGTDIDVLSSGVKSLTLCDEYGVKLISVPIEYIARFLTEEEAEVELRKEEENEAVPHIVLYNRQQSP